MKNLHQKFPPFPPSEKWVFSSCPQEERFTCLDYTCKALAQEKDPSFTDRLPPDWKKKYPQWPGTPYLQIPEHERRLAQPELSNIRKVMAEALIARSISEETFEALSLLNVKGSPLITRADNKTILVLEIFDRMSAGALLEHLEALALEYLTPHALTVRPKSGASYAQQLQADLNALSAYILLEHLTPADATALSQELLGHSLFSTPQKWRIAQARGELLVRKTLEGKLDAILVAERVASQLQRLKSS